jgi:predicted DNA-binding transcriptional regulator YafY
MERCNEALREHGFKEVSSENTIRTDLKEMEYQFPEAEIVSVRRGRNIFYRYKNRDFSIYKIPLNNNEIVGLTQALTLLSRFEGMPGSEWLDALIERFKPSINIDMSVKHVVGFDENVDLRGREHFATLLQAIVSKQVLLVRYTSYRNPKEFNVIIHPYYIRQYNNRWFLFGHNDELNKLTNIAFDRILEITPIPKTYIPNTSIDFFEFFDDMVGVSRSIDDMPEEVRLFISKSQSPYILSKPIHGSQRIIDRTAEGTIIALNLIINYELEQVILSFGNNVKVLSPISLVNRIKNRITDASKLYQ